MALTRDKLFWSAFSDHARQTSMAGQLLVEMLEHPERRESLAARIKEMEHRGDEITHETVQALHQTWITPLDREEIHALISALDDVLDFLDAASDRIALYEIAQVRPEAVDLARALSAAVTVIEEAVGKLTNMKQAQSLIALCKEVDKHEHVADQVFRRALARLFNERNDPIEVMKWRDILDALETATDKAKAVANIIEGIVLEHA